MTSATAASRRARGAFDRGPEVHEAVVDADSRLVSPAEQATAISRVVVQAMLSYTGRGPTRVHTVLDEQSVTVLLYDSMSRGDRNLLRDGAEQLVLEARHQALRSVERRVRGEVGTLAGRPVLAVLTSQHGAPDIASLTFVLQDERADVAAV